MEVRADPRVTKKEMVRRKESGEGLSDSHRPVERRGPQSQEMRILLQSEDGVLRCL